VTLERQDLLKNLEKIEQQEAKIRKKKEDKLSHLIPINKEVSKFYRKKELGSKPINRRVNTKKTKKRISYLKQMKSEFERNRERMLGLKPKE
jgi:hypothetical protein